MREKVFSLKNGYVVFQNGEKRSNSRSGKISFLYILNLNCFIYKLQLDIYVYCSE